MTRKIHRFEVPVDDEWHVIPLSTNPLHVEARRPGTVELWAVVDDGPLIPRHFRVYGTGQTIPDDVAHVGSALAFGGRLVWHLVEGARRA